MSLENGKSFTLNTLMTLMKRLSNFELICSWKSVFQLFFNLTNYRYNSIALDEKI